MYSSICHPGVVLEGTSVMTQKIYTSEKHPDWWIAMGTNLKWYMWPVSGTWADRRVLPFMPPDPADLQPADEETARRVAASADQVSDRESGPERVWIAEEAEPGTLYTFVSLSQAASYLNITPSTLRHAIRDGRLRAGKFGRDWVVLASEVARYDRERREINRSEG